MLVIFLSNFTLFTVVTTNYSTSMMDNSNAFAQRTPLEGVSNTSDKIIIEMNSVTCAP